ncbi:hypothetical protein [Burkholderia territorii]|uniref:hypothetical protein n=1 Tax=Burkholderia territorii TaxID=1503055 RepID=UPI000758A6B2|nr:hypothetical protein [Burkholderia territorii]KWA24789.1 hypothetical protein WT37_04350 [Burkholderia territorii]
MTIPNATNVFSSTTSSQNDASQTIAANGEQMNNLLVAQSNQQLSNAIVSSQAEQTTAEKSMKDKISL